ncbi:hypothetical protein WMY93_029345 [Mugilogobius chulae]|uniref:F-box domain-containing protein n=1 Tax=Mugilogobius chulae TaxID=88201 RepID=A0AAW0MWX7_9GOBI
MDQQTILRHLPADLQKNILKSYCYKDLLSVPLSCPEVRVESWENLLEESQTGQETHVPSALRLCLPFTSLQES